MAWRSVSVLVSHAMGILVGAGVVGARWGVGGLATALALLALARHLRTRMPASGAPTSRSPGHLDARALRLNARGCLALLLIPVAFGLGTWRGASSMRDAMAPPLRALGEPLTAPSPSPMTAVLEGRLRDDAFPTDYGVSFSLDVNAITVAGRRLETAGGIQVSVGGDMARQSSAAWRGGRAVRVPATLRAPQAYRNPGVPDQARALALRHITWLGSAKSGALVEVIEAGSPIRELTGAVRAHARSAIRGAFAVSEAPGLQGAATAPGAPPPTPAARAPNDVATVAGIVTAILIGDRAGVPPDITDRLQRAGTFHVIAISGGNIAIFTGVVYGCCWLLRVTPRVAAFVTMAAVAAYGMVATGSASVVRATAVAILYFAARTWDLRASGFAVLWSAMLAILGWTPLALLDAGFLLTCGATIALLVYSSGALTIDGGTSPAPRRRVSTKSGPRRSWAAHLARVLRWIASHVTGVVVATLAVDVVLLPVSTAYFSRVSIAGVLLNPAAIPLMGVAQVGGLGATIAWDWAPGVARVLARLAELSVQGLISSARLVDHWRWLSWRVPPPRPEAAVLYYLAWTTWVLLRLAGQRRIAHVALVPALGAVLWIAAAPTSFAMRSTPLPALPRGRAPQLALVFLDVGQGDATLLRFPSGRTWLIDAGGIPGARSFDVGARVVAPTLWATGLRRVDVLALTHGDPDHVGGAVSITRDFSPREVWEAVPVERQPLMAAVESEARATGTRWRRRYRPDAIVLDGVSVRVVHPSPPTWSRLVVRNDDSLTLELRYGDFRAVLPADIGAAAEEEIRADFRRAALTVLKVPHHGSTTSSTPAFLAALRPSLGIVSAGRANRFGHPSGVVLARYEALGVPLLRTDRDGAIAVVTDGAEALAASWDGTAWRERWRGVSPAIRTPSPAAR